MTDILQLFKDFNIPHQTEGHKHCRPGWVNTACPFCSGNPGLHLGATLDGKIFYCWRCGWHAADKAVAGLLKIPIHKAKQLLIEYVGLFTPTEQTKKKIRLKSFKFPSDTGSLEKRHLAYLESRNFDAKKLVKDWNLQATGPISILDKTNYSHRILAPVYWQDEVVTFQARDITNKNDKKYLACPTERELMHHKHIIYGKQEKWKDTGICVEGITDVWRIGFDAFATFGIKYTPQQLRLIAQTFKRVPVLFDDDPQAKIEANKLVAELRFRNVDSFRVDITGDPGELTEQETRYLIKHLT